MPNVELLQPTSIDEAVALLARDGGDMKIIAGGTAMVIMLRNRLIAPAKLFSIGRLRELSYVRHEPGTGLRIGALTTIRDVETSSVVRRQNPTLARTFAQVGNVRIRHAATVGGNLSEADYASDPPCVLMAMRARVKAKSTRGEREIPLTALFKGFYETALAPDEILTELIVPDLGSGTRSTYIKFVSRSSEDRPCAGVAAVVSSLSEPWTPALVTACILAGADPVGPPGIFGAGRLNVAGAASCPSEATAPPQGKAAAHQPDRP